MPWVPMLKNQEVADIPIVIASIDPCIGCMDRVTLVDSSTYKKEILTRDQLRKLSIEKTRRLLP